MVYPTKQQALDFIRQNAPIKTKKGFADVYKYIHQTIYNDETTEADMNEIMISFLTNTTDKAINTIDSTTARVTYSGLERLNIIVLFTPNFIYA